MKRYLFTVRIIGTGNNLEEAWKDAIECTDLYEDPIPDKDDWSEIENDDEDEY